jgi:hypothetical protein
MLYEGWCIVDKVRIVFFAANPESTTKIKLDEEIREITQKIRASDYRDSIELISAWAVRPDDLLQYLNQYKPQIVHFSGHGSQSGEIILVDPHGNPKPVSKRALQGLFSTLKDNIQVVLLNACYTRTQAEAISETINFVIGMNNAVGDEAAITFAASFYRAIGFNRTVQEAFDQARTALLLEGNAEDIAPEMLVKEGVSPASKVADFTLSSDKEILKQHRIIFDRPAFRVSCIDELFLYDISEAVDDTQAALNTGSLYSRSGKLLGTFPAKNAFQSDEIVQYYEAILENLASLKRTVETLRMDFRTQYFPNIPQADGLDTTHLVEYLAEQGNQANIRKVIQQMDEIDTIRNQILIQLNHLYQENGIRPFPLIKLTSDKLRNPDSLYSTVAAQSVARYLL